MKDARSSSWGALLGGCIGEDYAMLYLIQSTQSRLSPTSDQQLQKIAPQPEEFGSPIPGG